MTVPSLSGGCAPLAGTASTKPMSRPYTSTRIVLLLLLAGARVVPDGVAHAMPEPDLSKLADITLPRWPDLVSPRSSRTRAGRAGECRAGCPAVATRGGPALSCPRASYDRRHAERLRRRALPVLESSAQAVSSVDRTAASSPAV